MVRTQKLSPWILLVLILVTAVPVQANEPPPRPTPRQQLKAVFSPRNCAIFLAANAFVGLGFYQGVNWVKPPTEHVIVSEHDTNPDDPRFAVTEVRRAYAVVDGEVKNGAGETLPGSQDTQAIAAFRGHVLRLTKEGALSVYRPRLHTWVPLNTPPLQSVVSLQNELVVLTTEGEVLQFRDTEGGTLGFNENRVLVGGHPIEFQNLGAGFRRLISQTPKGYFQPETIMAVGEDVLVLKTLVPAQRIEKDSPARKALENRLK